MNYLAHVYLSGSNPELAVGNFIADSIKGKQYLDYPPMMHKGILLHRSIDDFTDKHVIFKKHVSLLFPRYRHYSRVIVDMYYDHFLALYWDNYHSDSLEEFSLSFYQTLEEMQDLFPDSIKRVIPIISKYNWFLSYRTLSGLENILLQMSKRTKFKSDLHHSIEELELHYDLIKADFFIFFDALENFVKNKLEALY